MVRFIVLFAFLLAIDFYAYQALRTLTQKTRLKRAYLAFHSIVYGYLCYLSIGVWLQNQFAELEIRTYIGILFLLYLPKLLLTLFLFAEDVFRGFKGIFQAIIHKKRPQSFLKSRRTALSQIGSTAALLFGGSLVYGFLKGRYDFQVRKVALNFPNLPQAFNGLKVVQISDIHIGSFQEKEAVAKGIQLINEQNPDIVLFTGDMVNNKTDELEGWIAVLSQINAKLGKFSILGNHDYGDYATWETPKHKIENLDQMKWAHAQMGFELLCNQNRFIEKEGQKLAIIGVENWGDAVYSQKYASLPNAFNQIAPSDFCILMSHDPSHWRAEVLPFQQHVPLTLSGHTHGLQLGVEIGGFKFSPAQWRYAEWAGLYEDVSGQKLYVNRGFGFIGLPARVGILPEITVFNLSST